MFLPYLLVGIALALVANYLITRYISFRGQKPEDYSAGPTFDIRERLNGPIDCEGVIYGPTGRVTSRFVAQFNAEWEGNRCVMREEFHYDSG